MNRIQWNLSRGTKDRSRLSMNNSMESVKETNATVWVVDVDQFDTISRVSIDVFSHGFLDCHWPMNAVRVNKISLRLYLLRTFEVQCWQPSWSSQLVNMKAILCSAVRKVCAADTGLDNLATVIWLEFESISRWRSAAAWARVGNRFFRAFGFMRPMSGMYAHDLSNLNTGYKSSCSDHPKLYMETKESWTVHNSWPIRRIWITYMIKHNKHRFSPSGWQTNWVVTCQVLVAGGALLTNKWCALWKVSLRDVVILKQVFDPKLQILNTEVAIQSDVKTHAVTSIARNVEGSGCLAFVLLRHNY